MKFQSLIARIMHGSRLATSVALLISSTSCISLIAEKNTYAADASSPAVKVNGASVRMQVKPEGTSGGSYALSAMVVSTAVATFDGPFSWRIEAVADTGKHEYFTVHRIRTRTTTTKRDEWYPVRYLGKRADFTVKKGEAGPPRAVYPIPGLLKVMPKVDGAMEIFVDLTVVGNGRRERKMVRFRMDPSQKRADEFIFVPTEIVENIGKSPSEWKESGWD
ncbi:MAG: hypothetical protein ABI600_12690 [Luteolibacter sp.]